ncbi:MAG: hypothetical protein ABW168_27270 [Sedimenticola sp.]
MQLVHYYGWYSCRARSRRRKAEVAEVEKNFARQEAEPITLFF